MKLIDLQNNINFWRKIPFLCIPLDTPLSLLTETVRSMLALSDLFCEHSQFRWMFDHFNEIQKTHPIEDEMLTNLLRIGICKSIAVLGKNTFCKGPFNNYVDKMRGRGGQKMSVFVHAQGIKTVQNCWGGQKMAEFCPRSC